MGSEDAETVRLIVQTQSGSDGLGTHSNAPHSEGSDTGAGAELPMKMPDFSAAFMAAAAEEEDEEEEDEIDGVEARLAAMLAAGEGDEEPSDAAGLNAVVDDMEGRLQALGDAQDQQESMPHMDTANLATPPTPPTQDTHTIADSTPAEVSFLGVHLTGNAAKWHHECATHRTREKNSGSTQWTACMAHGHAYRVRIT